MPLKAKPRRVRLCSLPGAGSGSGSGPRPLPPLALSLPFIFYVTYVRLAPVLALPGRRHMSLFRVIHFAAFACDGASRRQAPSRVSGSIWPGAGGGGGRRPAGAWRARQTRHLASESVPGRCRSRARPQLGDTWAAEGRRAPPSALRRGHGMVLGAVIAARSPTHDTLREGGSPAVPSGTGTGNTGGPVFLTPLRAVPALEEGH